MPVTPFRWLFLAALILCPASAMADPLEIQLAGTPGHFESGVSTSLWFTVNPYGDVDEEFAETEVEVAGYYITYDGEEEIETAAWTAYTVDAEAASNETEFVVTFSSTGLVRLRLTSLDEVAEPFEMTVDCVASAPYNTEAARFRATSAPPQTLEAGTSASFVYVIEVYDITDPEEPGTTVSYSGGVLLHYFDHDAFGRWEKAVTVLSASNGVVAGGATLTSVAHGGLWLEVPATGWAALQLDYSAPLTEVPIEVTPGDAEHIAIPLGVWSMGGGGLADRLTAIAVTDEYGNFVETDDDTLEVEFSFESDTPFLQTPSVAIGALTLSFEEVSASSSANLPGRAGTDQVCGATSDSRALVAMGGNDASPRSGPCSSLASFNYSASVSATFSISTGSSNYHASLGQPVTISTATTPPGVGYVVSIAVTGATLNGLTTLTPASGAWMQHGGQAALNQGTIKQNKYDLKIGGVDKQYNPPSDTIAGYSLQQVDHQPAGIIAQGSTFSSNANIYGPNFMAYKGSPSASWNTWWKTNLKRVITKNNGPHKAIRVSNEWVLAARAVQATALWTGPFDNQGTQSRRWDIDVPYYRGAWARRDDKSYGPKMGAMGSVAAKMRYTDQTSNEIVSKRAVVDRSYTFAKAGLFFSIPYTPFSVPVYIPVSVGAETAGARSQDASGGSDYSYSCTTTDTVLFRTATVGMMQAYATSSALSLYEVDTAIGHDPGASTFSLTFTPPGELPIDVGEEWFDVSKP